MFASDSGAGKVAIGLICCLFFFALPAMAETEKKTEQPAGVQAPVKDLYGPQPKVETVADTLEYSRADNKVIAKGNVVITYGSDRLLADYAEVETETKKAYATGHVIIFSNDVAKARGPEVHYDFEKHSGTFPQGSIIETPWHCGAEQIEQVREGLTKATRGRVSTCKGDNPPYEIRAKKVTIWQEDKMLLRNVTIYSLGKPIFWWPYLVVPLQDDNLPFQIKPGYRSEFGAYILATKGFSITKNVYGKLHADWRAKRGFGTGADLEYHFEKIKSQGFIRGYWTQDEDAPTPSADNEGKNPYAEREERDRGRLSWAHRTDLDDYSNILLRYHRLADEYFLQDFFEKEHRQEVEPQSFVTLTKNTEQYGFLTHASKRMNKFESLVERLPEVRFDWKNQPFFSPLVYYQNQTSYSSLSKRFNRSDYDEDVTRVDHVSEWFVPLKYDEIKFTPFFNTRGTYYSREKESDNNHMRLMAGWGADLRTQLYKTHNVSFDHMGIEINQLRHVFEPSIRYDSLKSTVSDEKLDHFDYIDKLDDQDVVTFGLENRFQTKRVVNGRIQRVDFVSLNTFLSYALHPDTPDSASSFTTWTQEVVLRPYEWLQYEIRMDYDFQNNEMGTFNQDILISRRRVDLLFGHRYISDVDEQDITGSNQFIFDGKYMVNKLWSLGGYVRWDAADLNLDEWQVSAVRDMDCLIMEFGYNVRNSSIRSSNKELFFELRLKDFPEFKLHGGGSRASFSRPRIGETVAGSSQLYPYRDYFSERYAPRTQPTAYRS